MNGVEFIMILLFFLLWLFAVLSLGLFVMAANKKGSRREEMFSCTNKNYKSYLIKVKDKNDIKYLGFLGSVTYISPITNLIGIDCIEEMVDILKTHPNVIEVIEDKTLGELMNDKEDVTECHLHNRNYDQSSQQLRAE